MLESMRIRVFVSAGSNADESADFRFIRRSDLTPPRTGERPSRQRCVET